jgi:hypothetical protein
MRSLPVLIAAAVLAGCGYVGDPLPPALNIAARVTDVRAVEYGSQLLIDFTIPALTTDELPLRRIGEIDLRIGPGGEPFSAAGWSGNAVRIPASATAPGPVHASVPVSDWVGKEVVIGVRLVNPKGRASEWSNFVSARIVPPVAPPAGVKAEMDPAGVKVTWAGANGKVRVYRKLSTGEKPALLDTVDGASYIDKSAENGKEYEYRAQALENGAESEVSEAAAITTRDVFPPAVPSGLIGLSGVGSVELVWDRNTEPDLRAYRVYRAVEGGEFTRVADSVETPAYSDRAVETGRKYRYAVSAVDQLGNESARCSPVEVQYQ